MPPINAVLLPDRGLLQITGDPAKEFLQSLISNDTRKLDEAHALYSALLTPQGKYLFDFFLYQSGDAILLESELGRMEELERRLILYRLRVPVEIRLVEPPWTVVALVGPECLAHLDLAAEPGSARRIGNVILAVDPRLSDLGARVLGPKEDVAAFLASIGAVTADFTLYDRLRLQLGVPDGGRDLVLNQSILLESNFEEIHGVAFDKGCFVGQELTARTKYRGLVKKRLVPVEFHGGVAAPGDLIRAGSREAGEVRSVNDDLGLALIRLDYLKGEGSESLLVGETVVQPRLPPWIKL